MDITTLIHTYPRTSIILAAILISFFITLVNYFILDKEKMRDLKQKQKVLGEEIKKHQKAGNHSKAMELNQQMLSHAMESMRHSFKPMLVTFIPIILIFAFLRGEFVGTTIETTWIWYYLVTSIIGSITFRKIFNLP